MKAEKALRAREIIQLYSNMNGGPAHTRAILALAMREGTIRTRFTSKWTTDESSLLRAWKMKRPDVVTENLDSKSKWTYIKRSFWHRSVCWLDDVSDWDFKLNRFHVTISLAPRQRILLSDVRFHNVDTRRVLATGALKLASTSAMPRQDSWRLFWHEVIKLATNNGSLLEQSDLAAFTSDDSAFTQIYKVLCEDNEISSDRSDQAVDALGDIIASRSPYGLSPSAIVSEIKALRQAFSLTRKYKVQKS
jgi:hypothetical protein